MYVGFVFGDTLPDAYEQSLMALNKNGRVSESEDWGTKCKEVQMVMKVKNPMKEPMISMLSIATPESLQKYIMEMLVGLMDWSINYGLEPYTYHDRIMRQYDEALDEIRRSKHTRRAAINVRTIEDCGSSDPACLQWIQFYVEDNKLNMTVLFRSNDACRATFMNAFALILIQNRAVLELRDTYPDLEIGEYTHIANSYHTYANGNGEFSLLENYCARLDSVLIDGDLDDIRSDYIGEWKDMMDEYIDDILEANELKRKEYGDC